MITAFIAWILGFSLEEEPRRSLKVLFRANNIRGLYFREHETGLNAYVSVGDMDLRWKSYVAPDTIHTTQTQDGCIHLQGTDRVVYTFHQIKEGTNGQPVLVLKVGEGDDCHLEEFTLPEAYGRFGLEDETRQTCEG